MKEFDMLKKYILFFICMLICLTNFSVGFCANKNAEAYDKINLVWQPVVDEANDLSQIAKLPGVNIVSPSWFVIDNANGHIKDNGDFLYARDLKKKDYKIWALITNDFNPELTHKWLNDEKAKAYIIRQMVFYAQRYPIDGYNFDFENIYDSDKDALSRFVEEATGELHKQGITVSMDITVASDTANWSSCYDRAVLGKTVDYLVLMAYDEHGRLSKTAGSVASINWVENGVKNLIAQVPPEKVILGVPLYMRLWEESSIGRVTASTLSMAQADELKKAKKAKSIWLPNEGQYYFSYRENGKTYHVWQEEAKSLQLKAALVRKYNLAGIASWRKGFETPRIWQVLDRELRRR